MAAEDEASAADPVCCAETRVVINATCPVLESAPCAAGRVAKQRCVRAGTRTGRARFARPGRRHYVTTFILLPSGIGSSALRSATSAAWDGPMVALRPLMTSQEPRQDSPQRCRRAQGRVKSAFRSVLSRSSVCSVVQYRFRGDLRHLDVAAELDTLRVIMRLIRYRREATALTRPHKGALTGAATPNRCLGSRRT